VITIFGKNKEILGIDIGSFDIKFVLVSKNKKIIRQIEIVNIPRDVVDKIEYIQNKIEKMIEEKKWNKKLININFNSDNIVQRGIKIPIIPENEIFPVIKREVEKLYGKNEGKKLIFENLGEGKDEKNGHYNIYFALIPQDEIDKYKKYKMKINSLDLPLFSKNRIYQEIVKEEENVLVLDLGESTTGLMIYSNKNLTVYREINIAGKDITAVLETILKKSEEDAEKLKRKYGYVSKKKAEQKQIEIENEMEAQLNFAYQSVMNKLSRKIVNSIEYFKINNRGIGIDKTYITGGTSELKGIKEFLETEIGSKIIEIYSGVESFEQNIEIKNPMLYTNALGSTLMKKPILKIAEKKENFIKGSAKKEKSTNYIIGIIIVSLVLGTYMYKKMMINHMNKNITEYVNNIKKIDGKVKEYDELKEEIGQIEDKIKWVDGATDKRSDFIDFFYNLSKMTPANIYFIEIKYEGNKVVLKGKSISKDTFPEIPINNFFKQLELRYKKVKLKGIQKTDLETSSFEMELILIG